MRTSVRSLATTAAVALGAVAGLGACGGESTTTEASDELQRMTADMVTYETTTYFLNAQGVRTGKIDADSAFYFQDSTVVHMQGVEMTVSTEAGVVRATVTADRGRYDERTQQMHALGNVVLVMPNDNRQVESGELYYDPTTEQIWSDSASTYRHQGRVTSGTCFKSDLNFSQYSVCNIRGSADFGGP
jgi:LPS export ABC transporter protein LptC